jgi:hypothetical protein
MFNDSKSSTELQQKKFVQLFASDHPLWQTHALPWKQRLVLSYLAYKTEWGGDTLAGIAEATGLNRKYGVKTALAALHKPGLVKPGEGVRWVATVRSPRKFIQLYCMAPRCPLTALENLIVWKLVDLSRKDEFIWDEDHRVTVLGGMIGEPHRGSIYRATAHLQQLGVIAEDWQVRREAILPEWYADPKKNKIKQKRREQLVEKLAPDYRDPPQPPPPPLKGMPALIQFVNENVPPQMVARLIGAIQLHVTEENASRVRAGLHVTKSTCNARGTEPTYEQYLKAIENGKC